MRLLVVLRDTALAYDKKDITEDFRSACGVIEVLSFSLKQLSQVNDYTLRANQNSF